MLKQSTAGDLNDIQQAVRGLNLPDNANLVSNKAATVTPSIGTPKSVTVFDAQGNPGRSGAVDSMAGIMADKPAGNYGYRVRDVGEEGLPISEIPRAHATTTARRCATTRARGGGRLEVQGKPQEIVRYDANEELRRD